MKSRFIRINEMHVMGEKVMKKLMSPTTQRE